MIRARLAPALVAVALGLAGCDVGIRPRLDSNHFRDYLEEQAPRFRHVSQYTLEGLFGKPTSRLGERLVRYEWQQDGPQPSNCQIDVSFQPKYRETSNYRYIDKFEVSAQGAYACRDAFRIVLDHLIRRERKVREIYGVDTSN